MSEIDWGKAPEGATHWMPGSYDWKEGFWKRKGDENYFHTGEAWYPSGAKPFGHPKLIERPSPAWSGEGLPPVGVSCEYRSGYVEEPSEYSKCEIIAHFRGESGQVLAAFTYIAHDGVVGLGRGAPSLFRPIRTPEQIAADERESVIEHMLRTYLDGAKDHRGGIRALYDAGYRKP